MLIRTVVFHDDFPQRSAERTSVPAGKTKYIQLNVNSIILDSKTWRCRILLSMDKVDEPLMTAVSSQ